MASVTIKVEGQRELMRALARTPALVKREMRGELKQVAEPVRAAAATLAEARIRNIDANWARMKVGVTQRYVYVAPAARKTGAGTPRKNLAKLWMRRALLPAARSRREQTRQRFEQWIQGLVRRGGL